MHGGRAVDQQSQPFGRRHRGCRAAGRDQHAPVPAPHPHPQLHTRGELTVPVPPALQQRAFGWYSVNVDDRCSHLLHQCPRPGGAPQLVSTWRLLLPPPIQPARRAAAHESTIHVARVQRCTGMCTTPPLSPCVRGTCAHSCTQQHAGCDDALYQAR